MRMDCEMTQCVAARRYNFNEGKMNIHELSSTFDKSQISWRAQSVTKDGKKAMALAYIDARDVMRRLDEVVGVAGWQCRYTSSDKKTICEIGIKIADEWIWKANGAGDTDIEAEKGAISDAFKRAAVMWGIGRYLYDLDAPWVPCSSYERSGKHVWQSWTDDPWKYIKNPPKPDIPKAAKKEEAQLPNLSGRAAIAILTFNECQTQKRYNKLKASGQSLHQELMDAEDFKNADNLKQAMENAELRAKKTNPYQE